MRIGLVTEWYPPDIGGVASHVRDLSKYLVKRGHEVVIITRRRNGYRRGAGNVIEIPSAFSFENILVPPDLSSLSEVIVKSDLDILHSHHAFTLLPLMSLIKAHGVGIGTVLTNHSSYLNDYSYVTRVLGYAFFPVKFILTNYVDRIIAVSRTAASFIRAFTGTKDVEIIYNGVDTERFNPHGSRIYSERIRGDPKILFVGRLVYRKGPHILIKAFEIIRREYRDAVLIIAGEGSMKGRLMELIDMLGLRENVAFVGKISDEELPDLYRSVDLCVIPSLFGESFGIVAIEAMASGTPIIASNSGGLREIITDGYNGLLFEPENYIMLAEKAIDLLGDDLFRRRIVMNALRTVDEKFSWNVIIDKILNIYLELLQYREVILEHETVVWNSN